MLIVRLKQQKKVLFISNENEIGAARLAIRDIPAGATGGSKMVN